MSKSPNTTPDIISHVVDGCLTAAPPQIGTSSKAMLVNPPVPALPEARKRWGQIFFHAQKRPRRRAAPKIQCWASFLALLTPVYHHPPQQQAPKPSLAPQQPVGIMLHSVGQLPNRLVSLVDVHSLLAGSLELELATLGFAVLNGFMYYFWWNKPLGVQTSVPVYLLDTPTDNADSTEKAQVDGVREANNDRNNEKSTTTTGIGATGGAYSTLEDEDLPVHTVDHESDHCGTTAEKLKTIGFDVLKILSDIFYHWPVNAVIAIVIRWADMTSV
ncbi:hypothetical protein BDZ97DRAFT_1921238 [Flammula alnicola]|nr:hypothetical protein BDZ97DRAFT_1921238 [Flammula alnicola]